MKLIIQSRAIPWIKRIPRGQQTLLAWRGTATSERAKIWLDSGFTPLEQARKSYGCIILWDQVTFVWHYFSKSRHKKVLEYSKVKVHFAWTLKFFSYFVNQENQRVKTSILLSIGRQSKFFKNIKTRLLNHLLFSFTFLFFSFNEKVFF